MVKAWLNKDGAEKRRKHWVNRTNPLRTGPLMDFLPCTLGNYGITLFLVGLWSTRASPSTNRQRWWGLQRAVRHHHLQNICRINNGVDKRANGLPTKPEIGSTQLVTWCSVTLEHCCYGPDGKNGHSADMVSSRQRGQASKTTCRNRRLFGFRRDPVAR